MRGKLITLIVFLTFMNNTFAETIWCKAFKVGCTTDEQLIKQRQYCEQRGNQAYRENFEKALIDPAVWQYAGAASAQDYAEGTKRLAIATCFKMSTPQSF